MAAIRVGIPIAATLISILCSARGAERWTTVFIAAGLGLAIVVTAAIEVARRRRLKQRARSALAISALCLSAVVSVAVTHWPLRVAYAWSRASLEEVAARVRLGDSVSMPIRAGAFTICWAELSQDGSVRLWTHLDLAGNTGFVQASPYRAHLHAWSTIALDDRWLFVAED